MNRRVLLHMYKPIAADAARKPGSCNGQCVRALSVKARSLRKDCPQVDTVQGESETELGKEPSVLPSLELLLQHAPSPLHNHGCWPMRFICITEVFQTFGGTAKRAGQNKTRFQVYSLAFHN
jgi:hypothetical protein